MPTSESLSDEEYDPRDETRLLLSKVEYLDYLSILTQWFRRHRADIIAVIVLFITLFGGAAVFWASMGYVPSAEGHENPFAWTYFNCVYFTVQMVTAIGYGDFAPAALPVGAKIFLPLYSYFGLGVSWIALQVIPDVVESLIKGFIRRVLRVKGELTWYRPSRKFVVTMLIQLMLCILTSFVFHHLEGWSYGDCIYYAINTMTTIGYGDFAPVTFEGRLYFMFFVFFQMGGFFHYFEGAADYVVYHAREQAPKIAEPRYDARWRQWLFRNKRWLWGLAGFTAFVLLGGFACFIIVGEAWITYDPLVDPVPVLVNGTFPWTYPNCLYACVEIITSVNHGDFVPVTPSGKAFVSFYSVAGLLVLTWCVCEIAAHLIATGATVFVIRMRKGGTGILRRDRSRPRPKRFLPPPIGPQTVWQRLRRVPYTEMGRMILLAAGYALWCMVFAGLFTGVELLDGNHDFYYGSTVFLAFQCITTGGLGFPHPGMYPTTPAARAMWIPFCLGGLLLITAMLTAAGELVETVLDKLSGKKTEPLQEERRIYTYTML